MEFIWGIGILKVVLGHAMSQYVVCKHYFNQNLKSYWFQIASKSKCVCVYTYIYANSEVNI